MMIPMLTPELSRRSTTRVGRGLPTLVLGLIGLIGTAACSGSVDDNKDEANSRPTSNDTANDPAGTRNTTATGTSNTADGTDTSDVGSREQEAEDLSNVSGTSSNAGSRRNGGTRRVRNELVSDAGAIDAGEVDGGVVEVDAGVEVEVDAGVADSGL